VKETRELSTGVRGTQAEGWEKGKRSRRGCLKGESCDPSAHRGGIRGGEKSRRDCFFMGMRRGSLKLSRPGKTGEGLNGPGESAAQVYRSS